MIMYWMSFVLFVKFSIGTGYLYFDVSKKTNRIKYLLNFFGAVIFGGFGVYALVEYYIIYGINHRTSSYGPSITTHLISYLVLFFFLILGYYLRLRKENKKKSQITSESE